MNSAKNLALIFLGLVALAGVGIAWRQSTELAALRAAAGKVDRDEWQRRVAVAEKRARDLADQLATAQDQLARSTKPVAKAEAPKSADDKAGAHGSSENLRTMMTNAANMMNRPDMQRMMAMSQKAALDSNYAKLFKQLNFAPEKLEQLKKLMVERQTVGSDVFSAAIQQGLDPMQNRAEIRKLTADAQSKVDGEIKTLLGDTDYAAYQNYQASLPQRNVVNQLQQSLSYTPTPLTETQAEQLVQILAANPVARPAAAVRIYTTPGGAPADAGQNVTATRTMVFAGSAGAGGGDFVAPVVSGAPALIGGAQISDAAVTASRSVLTDPQYQALQQMQQQQAQMRAMMQQPGGMAMPVGGGVIRIESNTTTAPASPPAAGARPPGGE
ncbi:MAG: hypothetical protein HZA93_00025 [Verrucomicrobia bacterium]|nr:hypothetical protein [Verrucomicrobiota bacterium]